MNNLKLQKKSLILLGQVQKVIAQYNFSLTLRQIYYQLVSKQIIPNQQRYYRQLSRLCVIGRDEGILPEGMFTDRLRQIEKSSSWLDLKDFMETVKNSYRKDIWINQDNYLEIWTEKDALREVIRPITDKWDVGFLVVRGQVSRTAIYEAYLRFKLNSHRGKKCHLFYFGDFDPSGLAIYQSLVERLQNFDGSVLPINFKRVALTINQINQYNLPQDPCKQSDPNYGRFVKEYGDNVVELDALPPNVLKNLVESYITNLIDEKKLAQVQKVEKAEKMQLEEWAELMGYKED